MSESVCSRRAVMVAGFSNLVLIPHFVQENKIICLCSKITLLSLLSEICHTDLKHFEKKNSVFSPLTK